MAQQHQYMVDSIKNLQLIVRKYAQLLEILSKNSTAISSLSIIDQDTVQQIINAIVTLSSQSPHILAQIYIKANLGYFNVFSKLILESCAIQYQANNQNKNIENIINLQSKYLNECYSEFSRIVYELLECLNLNTHTKRSALFHVKLLLEALDPDHSIIFNKLMTTNGLNTNWQYVVDVLDNIILDLKDGKTFLDITTINTHAFEIGKNVATTQGKIIYRNDLVEIIFYKPSKKVHTTPIFIVPPCINKYYILDLSPNHSFVKWLVDNNFEVFMVSWINPDKSLRNKNFDNYLQEGILDPVKYIKTTLKYKNMSAIGYCIGGTLLGCAEAFAAKTNLKLFSSVTLLASLLDFSDIGNFGLFLTQKNLAALKIEVGNDGYLNGRKLNYVFSLLRSKELIWNVIINNYFAKKQPPSFDILYWNADSTHLPEAMYLFYIENFYINNLLARKNKLSLLDTKLDLSKITTPIFYLGAKNDHIVAWTGAYRSLQLCSSSTDAVFCLTAAGHIAGVMNHPQSHKYSYRAANNLHNVSHETFLKNTIHQDGSWWNDWLMWQKKYAGAQNTSHRYTKLCNQYICDAPGTYVRKRIQ